VAGRLRFRLDIASEHRTRRQQVAQPFFNGIPFGAEIVMIGMRAQGTVGGNGHRLRIPLDARRGDANVAPLVCWILYLH
jgi:hypothetical protein